MDFDGIDHLFKLWEQFRFYPEYSPIKFMRANTKLFKVGEKLNFQIKQERDRLSQSLPSKPSFCGNWQIGYFHQFQPLSILAAWNSHTNTSVSFSKACLSWNWQEPKWRKGKMSGSLEALGSSWYQLTSPAGLVFQDLDSVGLMHWLYTKLLSLGSYGEWCSKGPYILKLRS